MTDPYPKRRRHGRRNRTEHGREPHNRRHDSRSPSGDAVDAALRDVARHDVPGTPSVGTLRTLTKLAEAARSTDTRTVCDFSIRSGDPQHGALRSDDHVGRYSVRLPLSEVSDDAYAPDECRECGCGRGLYKYRAYHHISGSESLFCGRCETELYHEGWG